MALELRQQLKLTQQLVMTPQLQQAIRLLQLSRLELAAAIEQELAENPVLEIETDEAEAPEEAREAEEPRELDGAEAEVKMDESAIEATDWENYINEYDSLPRERGPVEVAEERPSPLDRLSRAPDLQSHLLGQLRLSRLDEAGIEAGEFIIGNINRDGYLEVDLDAVCGAVGCDPATAAKALAAVQDMDPAGVGARDVRECLLLQLERLGLADGLAARIVRDHLKLLETRNYNALVRACGGGKEEVLAAVETITGLDPFPGRQYSEAEVQYIVPDVYVHKEDGEYVVTLNDDGIPRLRFSAYYRRIMEQDGGDPAARKYILEKFRSGKWLIDSIEQRRQTIRRVVESIVRLQRDFLDHGVEHLKPMVLRDVAEDIGMHESTVSRVTSNKYVHTPQGTYELKFFFNSAISRADGGEAHASAAIKNRIKAIIAAEDPAKPLSDQAIADMFKARGVKLARRTVAKYREQLKILPSKLRRRLS